MSVAHRSGALPSCNFGRDLNGNLPPGTLVDAGCTQPFEFNVYLCSHAAIKDDAVAVVIGVPAQYAHETCQRSIRLILVNEEHRSRPGRNVWCSRLELLQGLGHFDMSRWVAENT
jgi:hypothetical protein